MAALRGGKAHGCREAAAAQAGRSAVAAPPSRCAMYGPGAGRASGLTWSRVSGEMPPQSLMPAASSARQPSRSRPPRGRWMFRSGETLFVCMSNVMPAAAAHHTPVPGVGCSSARCARARDSCRHRPCQAACTAASNGACSCSSSLCVLSGAAPAAGVRFGGAWMPMAGPNSSRATATVHSSSSSGGSGAPARAAHARGAQQAPNQAALHGRVCVDDARRPRAAASSQRPRA